MYAMNKWRHQQKNVRRHVLSQLLLFFSLAYHLRKAFLSIVTQQCIIKSEKASNWQEETAAFLYFILFQQFSREIRRSWCSRRARNWTFLLLRASSQTQWENCKSSLKRGKRKKSWLWSNNILALLGLRWYEHSGYQLLAMVVQIVSNKICCRITRW